MTKKSHSLLAAILVTLLSSMACQQGPEPEQLEMATEASAPESATPAALVEEVTYEPAYPQEVSTDELSAEDVAQQTENHSHGDGPEHSHGDQATDDDHEH